jgi:predicted RNase H-like nuclease (RuvC/YqgF family)
LISSLQQQLQEEKEARQRLESELESLKRMSLDIQNSLKNQTRRGK